MYPVDKVYTTGGGSVGADLYNANGGREDSETMHPVDKGYTTGGGSVGADLYNSNGGRALQIGQRKGRHLVRTRSQPRVQLKSA